MPFLDSFVPRQFVKFFLSFRSPQTRRYKARPCSLGSTACKTIGVTASSQVIPSSWASGFKPILLKPNQAFNIWMIKTVSMWCSLGILTGCAWKPEGRAATYIFPEMPLGQLFSPLRPESLLLVAAVRDKLGQNLLFQSLGFSFCCPFHCFDAKRGSEHHWPGSTS